MKKSVFHFTKFLHQAIIHGSKKQKRENKYTTGVVLEWPPGLNRGAFFIQKLIKLNLDNLYFCSSFAKSPDTNDRDLKAVTFKN